jgi:hypothetical protein
MKILNVKPILEEFPNSNGEAAMNKEVVVGFLGLLTKWAKPTIFPPTLP